MTYAELKEQIAVLDEAIKAKNLAKAMCHLRYSIESSIYYKEYYNKKVTVTLDNGLKIKGYFCGFDVNYSPSVEVRILMYTEKKDGTMSKKTMYVPGTNSTDYDKIKIELV